jgi:hypothetical protein
MEKLMIGEIIMSKPTTTKVIMGKKMIIKLLMAKPASFFLNYGKQNYD